MVFHSMSKRSYGIRTVETVTADVISMHNCVCTRTLLGGKK